MINLAHSKNSTDTDCFEDLANDIIFTVCYQNFIQCCWSMLSFTLERKSAWEVKILYFQTDLVIASDNMADLDSSSLNRIMIQW